MLKKTCDSVFERPHFKGLNADTKAISVFTAENEATYIVKH